jgi:hypothetical protein
MSPSLKREIERRALAPDDAVAVRSFAESG